MSSALYQDKNWTNDDVFSIEDGRGVKVISSAMNKNIDKIDHLKTLSAGKLSLVQLMAWCRSGASH